MLLFEGITSHESSDRVETRSALEVANRNCQKAPRFLLSPKIKDFRGPHKTQMEFASGRYNENLRPKSEAFEAKLQNKPKRPTN